eukprot:gnl/MRDRNA2_/MRDRNA2_23936_c0_seq1.p1 gnl/MRDRNA2_/MRDRNA2_23936_c0~~gnl/MRDRNA2_/MRDRNA2_23936_c0_seq1.p1  ORF type:complete len:473 (-),score=73.58 gnl/MRDRNA2_/MRDRNA2_23936_c0_seq1:51-1469(-)
MTQHTCGGIDNSFLVSPNLAGQPMAALDGHGLAAAELLASLRHTLQVGVSMALQRLHPEAEVTTSLRHLNKFNCSCHVGFYSNEQTICNLLHLIVQLALFNEANTAKNHAGTEPPSEEEQRALGWKADAAEGPEPPTVVEAETQADVFTAPKKKKRPADPSPTAGRYGVRIGGGFHIVAPSNVEEHEVEDTCDRARSESPIAEERLKEYSQDYNMHQATAKGHLYAQGAPSDATPASRFVIGAYTNVEMSKYHDRSSLRSGSPGRTSGGGHPIQLYRVLRPAQGHEYVHSQEVPPPHDGRYDEVHEASSNFEMKDVATNQVHHPTQTREPVEEPGKGEAAQGMESVPQPSPVAQPDAGVDPMDETSRSYPGYSPAPREVSTGLPEQASIQYQTLQRTKNGPAPRTPERVKTPTRGPGDRGRALPESPRIKRSRSAGPPRYRNADPRPVGSASKAAMSRNWNNAHVKSELTGV